MDEVLDALVKEFGELAPGLPVPNVLRLAHERRMDFHGYASMARTQLAFLEYYEQLQQAEAERAAAAAAPACTCPCACAARRGEVTPAPA